MRGDGCFQHCGFKITVSDVFVVFVDYDDMFYGDSNDDCADNDVVSFVSVVDNDDDIKLWQTIITTIKNGKTYDDNDYHDDDYQSWWS